ncbi:prepilin peptidase [Litchfieldia salsa]|uniref:Leader peptidase (Prepilin peptidase) / N-methyltransferase n=1 Tax=Litchfieldia salsa TaxID=930152 RepID=A0A1H0NU07_9BACI|nr:A24 family peptidase [Litchfieldia salsa]SDO96133.1 leader peptidase (prepilin peptidase) / N-methyltransferase [Litchfieldia salsa]
MDLLDLYHVYIFILGIVLGSFYNVVGLRIPKAESIVFPRSACPNCRHELTVKELIPLLSYLYQKGSCKKCFIRISPLYPSVEMVTAILFTISPLLVGWSKELIVSWTLVSLLMIIFVSDLKYMIIPDKVLLFFAPLFLIERVFIPLTPWWDMLLGSLVGFTLLFIIALVSRGGMGGGDIKLYAVLGLVLGWKLTLLSFFLATIIGTLIGLIGMVTGKVKRGKPMPFGPAIVLGTLLAYYFGQDIINWYITIVVS